VLLDILPALQDMCGVMVMGESGRAMARTGLRMMPTSPSPPLKFRTVSFPQYGFKASLSDPACPGRREVKPAPSIPSGPGGFAVILRAPPDYAIPYCSGT